MMDRMDLGIRNVITLVFGSFGRITNTRLTTPGDKAIKLLGGRNYITFQDFELTFARVLFECLLRSGLQRASTTVMPFLPRNSYYLRVSSSSILPLYVGSHSRCACRRLIDHMHFIGLSGQRAC